MFPILPQCDSFLIIVFPVSLPVLFGHMSIAWRIRKKARVLRRFIHIYVFPGNAQAQRINQRAWLPAAQQNGWLRVGSNPHTQVRN
ncbi:hypothetical protein [Paraburkholderia rhynchosiae]|uniref:hypothetical protein n=1 Tax=Paraburkholderia rhynchosiae TaxID=487049 RepID=UPI0011AED597|nr:hypothetical protein [Paraburkholderia rhynchosiae]